jgi:MoaA/NifB/PqqE/SkfB family radical SAM enzyme
MAMIETAVEIRGGYNEEPPEVAFESSDTPPNLMWLELTGKCTLNCSHCYAESGPQETHGDMSLEDWVRVIDEGCEIGIENVQFIGGEPLLHPNAAELIEYAASKGLFIEVYSNLAYVPRGLWELFEQHGVNLATSWYSDNPEVHDEITGVRGSHRKTLGNITEARQRDIPLRVGMIDLGKDQNISEAAAVLVEAGVDPDRIRIDRKREFGRAKPAGLSSGTPPSRPWRIMRPVCRNGCCASRRHSCTLCVLT